MIEESTNSYDITVVLAFVGRGVRWHFGPAVKGGGQKSLKTIDLDDYGPITLQNTELKILAQVLANRLQLVISDLIGPEQNYGMKGRSIQDNLHLVHEILEGLRDDTKAALINLDQSQAFDRMDHRFLVTVLETAGFQPDIHKWIRQWCR